LLLGYGLPLCKLELYPKALAAEKYAMALFPSLVSKYDGPYHKGNLACALQIHGVILSKTGCLEDALSVEREAVSLFCAVVVHGKEEQKERLALALQNCGYTLSEMGCLEDALSVQQEVVSLFCVLPVHGQEERKMKLADALKVYRMYRTRQYAPETILENIL